MKQCVDCKIFREDGKFYVYELAKNRGRCKICLRERAKKWSKNNPEKKKMADDRYREGNKEYLKQQKKIYVESNSDIVKERQRNWYDENKPKLLENAKTYRLNNKKQRNDAERTRRRNDPVYRLRTNLSKLISQKLKQASSSKSGSILDYLPYTIDELRIHLEGQFESWMNWDNYGKYLADNWDNNDTSTWTWQIDHIIPQSTLPYVSMEEENFKKCWSLENLRPLSSKTNVLLGTALSKKRKA